MGRYIPEFPGAISGSVAISENSVMSRGYRRFGVT